MHHALFKLNEVLKDCMAKYHRELRNSKPSKDGKFSQHSVTSQSHNRSVQTVKRDFLLECGEKTKAVEVHESNVSPKTAAWEIRRNPHFSHHI